MTAPPPALATNRARGMLIGATLLWGLSFPLLRGLELAQAAHARDVSHASLAAADMAVRFLGAALLLLPFCWRQLFSISREEWSQAGGLALFGGIGLYLQTLGLAQTNASVSAFLTQLYTLVVPLIVACRDSRRPTVRVSIACVLVLFGAALLSPGLTAHLRPALGEGIIMISTVFLAGQIVWVERPRHAVNRAGLVTFLMFALMGVASAALFPLLGGNVAQGVELFGTLALALLMTGTVVFCTGLNYYIMNEWQRGVSATEAGLIYCIEPVIATVLCSFLPGWISRAADVVYANEPLGWNLLGGGVLIIGATILVATEKRIMELVP